MEVNVYILENFIRIISAGFNKIGGIFPHTSDKLLRLLQIFMNKKFVITNLEICNKLHKGKYLHATCIQA